jgi:hypothetical protein
MPPLAIAPKLDMTEALASANDNEPMSTFLLVLKGQIAALTGETLGDNPFKLDSPEGRCWTTGWLNIQAELQEDAPVLRPAPPAYPNPRDASHLRIVLTATGL